MPGKTIKIRSTDGGEFDCYLATPRGRRQGAGRRAGLRGARRRRGHPRSIADEFAGHGFIAAAPDLFWRTVPGPLGHDDKRTQERSQPRLEKIKTGERDMADTLAHLSTLPQFNGRAAAMGFCYGGPYAILGPKRLGYDAGISCHGTQMLDYIKELDGVTEPVCIIWGDQDHRAPPEVLDAYRPVPSRMKNVEVHIFPGILHGYMMPGSPEGLRPEDARFLDGARARDPRWTARRRRGDAQGVVVFPMSQPVSLTQRSTKQSAAVSRTRFVPQSCNRGPASSVHRQARCTAMRDHGGGADDRR